MFRDAKGSGALKNVRRLRRSIGFCPGRGGKSSFRPVAGRVGRASCRLKPRGRAARRTAARPSRSGERISFVMAEPWTRPRVSGTAPPSRVGTGSAFTGIRDEPERPRPSPIRAILGAWARGTWLRGGPHERPPALVARSDRSAGGDVLLKTGPRPERADGTRG